MSRPRRFRLIHPGGWEGGTARPIVIEFKNGLRYVAGLGFIRDGQPATVEQVASELHRLWHEDAHEARRRGQRRMWERRKGAA